MQFDKKSLQIPLAKIFQN